MPASFSSGHPQCVPIATEEPFGHIRCNCNPMLPSPGLSAFAHSSSFRFQCVHCGKRRKPKKGLLQLPFGPLVFVHYPPNTPSHLPSRFISDDVRKRFNSRLSLVFHAFNDAQKLENRIVLQLSIPSSIFIDLTHTRLLTS